MVREGAVMVQARQSLGAHYTDEKIILRVIRPLFLDNLWSEYHSAKGDTGELRALQNRLAHLCFLDPACGRGDFLVVIYRELRRLETAILERLRDLSGEYDAESKISLSALHGIEIDASAAQKAQAALIAAAAEFGACNEDQPRILHGNALRTDWTEVFPELLHGTCSAGYLVGNPPFIGKKARSRSQIEDMRFVCLGMADAGLLDYAAAWFVKAAEFVKGTKAQAAFISTNSMAQGEQVGILWEHLHKMGMQIQFAHRTFRWRHSAREDAAVYCVIIGFASANSKSKRLFDYPTPDAEPLERRTVHINPYLVDAEDVTIVSRERPLCDVPEMRYGSMPNDHGCLLLTESERDDLLQASPHASPFVKPFVSAREFLHGNRRWCLWLVDAAPDLVESVPEIARRVKAVRDYRASSHRRATERLSMSPELFGENRQPDCDFLLIPRHTSENRRCVPMAFFSKDYIAGDSCLTLPGATWYHAGVLMSAMHMAWMRQVCGCLEGRYRYSATIVYNNFPWPLKPGAAERRRVAEAVNAVMEARKRFPECNLAELYDPAKMPQSLCAAHKALDKAVDECYSSGAFRSDLERLEVLFGLYRNHASTRPVEPMTFAPVV